MRHLIVGLIFATVLVGQDKVDEEKVDLFTDSQRLEIKNAEVKYWQASSALHEARLAVKLAMDELNNKVEVLKQECRGKEGRIDASSGNIKCMMSIDIKEE